MTSLFADEPHLIQRTDVAVMEQSAADEFAQIKKLWPSFERLVGLRGRQMYARVDERANTYTVCTPVRDDDRPDELGLRSGTLSGGWYLRGRLAGEPPELYGRIGPAMTELKAAAELDETRELVEFYRRHDRIELWVPVTRL
jgi:hypothetical protein